MQQIIYRTGRTSMLIKIAIGFFLGIIFGFVAAPLMPYYPVLSDHVMPFLELAGKVFLRILAMITIPLVFSSLISGIASTGDTKKLGRIGFKTIALFLLTTFIAACVGMLFANLIKPGSSINVSAGINDYSDVPKPTRDFLLNIFPVNPIASMFNANMLHIIVFAVFVGIACIFTGETGGKIAHFFEHISEIMQKVTQIVMLFAPFGVFALAATVAEEFGLTLIAPFAKIIAAVYGGCIFHGFVVYSLIVLFFCRRSPKWFFDGMREPAITAFVTRSSTVTLPVTLESVQNNLGVSKEVSSFVLPLGSTLNMDGTAIYQTVCALFVARAYNVPLTLGLQVSIFTAAVIASIGTVGVPSGGMIMLTMVLTSAGLPVEAVGLVAGIDVVLGPARTCLNVIGDGAVCAAVAASEGENLTRINPSGRMRGMKYGA